MLKKIALGLLLVLISGIGYGIYYVEKEFAGIGLPWNDAVDLPTLPTFSNVTTQLSANDEGEIFFPSHSPYDFSVLLTDFDNAPPSTGKGTLFFPDKTTFTAPIPAMIILHGSGGLRPEREFAYARLFNEMGIAAFVLDYYSPRGVTEQHSYLQKTLTTSETDIIVDAYAALRLLGSHPLIDASKIGVTGYSYGGMATRYALDSRIKRILAPDHPPFAAHADFYGPCHQTLGDTQFERTRYLAVFGDSDNSVDPAQCAIVHQTLADHGVQVETLMIANAGHAWENEQPRALNNSPYINGCTMGFAKDDGTPLINEQPVSHAAPGASREHRAYMRARIMMDAPECIGRGYIIGQDSNADKMAKARLVEFLTDALLAPSSSI